MPDPETDEAPRKLELSPVQVAASALAAVSAAFFASVAGTAGTLIGAAAGSIIATVGAATYSYSLRRTSEIARRTAEQVREGNLLSASLPRPVRPPGAGDTRRMRAVDPDGDPDDEAAGSSVGEEDQPPTGWRRFDPRRAQLPWGKVALASAAVLVITMVVLTSFEAVTGRSVADVTRGSDSGRTTVGNVFREDSPRPAEQPAPQEDQGDEGQDPAPDPSPAPTQEPTSTPTEAPTTAPTEQPPADPTPTTVPTPAVQPTGEPQGAPAAPSPTPSPSVDGS